MSFELVEAEIDWVVYLVNNEVPAVKLIQSINERFIEKVEKDAGHLNVVVFEKAEGKHLDHGNPQDWSDEIIIECGRMTGRMHALSKNYEVKEAKRYHFKPSMDIEWLLKGEESEVVDQIKNLFQEIENLPKKKDGYGLVHGDLHSGNFFVTEDKITAILDFDRTCYKWFISEIAVALYYPLYLTQLNKDRDAQEEFVKRFLPLFMDGYEEEHKLDSDWMKKLNIFIQVRDVILFMYLPKELEDMKKHHRPRILEKYLISMCRK